MTRPDLFSAIHKGLRGALFELATELARVELTSCAAVDRWLARLEEVLGYLDEHARIEDAHVMLALRGLDPALADALAGEHRSLAIVQSEVERLAEQLALAELANRPAAASRLLIALNHLIAIQLMHMNREEVEVNEALWVGLDDHVLAQLRARGMAEIAPDQLAHWSALITAFTSPVDRHLVDSARVG